jgi:hypothetical protein
MEGKKISEKDVSPTDELGKSIQRAIETSSSFAFLNSEEELYTLADLKETYDIRVQKTC